MGNHINNVFSLFRIKTIPGLMIPVMFVFLLSCSDDEGVMVYEPDYLVDYESLTTIQKDEIMSTLTTVEFPVPGPSIFIRYDVEVIRITYHTESYGQQPVVASGLLIVPKGDESFPVISFQHGTIYDPAEAPSLMNSVYSDLGAFLASTGFVTMLPDYIGYGVSDHLLHPYQHRESLAMSTRDMIRAAYEYFKVKQETEPSDKIFLTGYSQGGYATLAALKMMQEQHPDEFNIVAATAGGGPYNKTASVKEMLSLDTELEGINTYMWVIDTYNRIYPSLNRPTSFYFNEPWATMIAEGGVFTPVEMNPTLLFTEAFRNGILNGTDQDMMNVLADNDIYDWRPGVPLQLYHGTDDMLVSYMNAVTAWEAMTEAGASKVELKPVEGGTHLSAFWDYLFGTFTFFLPLVLS